jgi:hypothetical protein
MLAPPRPDEYFEYYGRYIALVPPGDVRQLLVTQLQETTGMLSGVSDARAERAYAPGKWTLKEAIGHVSDTERVFAYRLLRIARGDATPLPGFEQDEWVPMSGANGRSMASLLAEFSAVRSATVQLATSLSDEAWLRRGTASGHAISARALAYLCAGHERHHQQVMREKYLG